MQMFVPPDLGPEFNSRSQAYAVSRIKRKALRKIVIAQASEINKTDYMTSLEDCVQMFREELEHQVRCMRIRAEYERDQVNARGDVQ